MAPKMNTMHRFPKHNRAPTDLYACNGTQVIWRMINGFFHPSSLHLVIISFNSRAKPSRSWALGESFLFLYSVAIPVTLPRPPPSWAASLSVLTCTLALITLYHLPFFPQLISLAFSLYLSFLLFPFVFFSNYSVFRSQSRWFSASTPQGHSVRPEGRYLIHQWWRYNSNWRYFKLCCRTECQETKWSTWYSPRTCLCHPK